MGRHIKQVLSEKQRDKIDDLDALPQLDSQQSAVAFDRFRHQIIDAWLSFLSVAQDMGRFIDETGRDKFEAWLGAQPECTCDDD